MTEAKKRKVICPECGKEVELTNGEGVCSGCDLDVGWVFEKRRRDKAVDKLKEQEEGEGAPPKRGGRFNFGS